MIFISLLTIKAEEKMKRIFVVDDEESICETLTWMLEEERYDVTTEMDFDKALEIIENQDFDAYFIDLIFPGRNGIELIKKIRKLQKEGIVIIITGYPNIPTLVDSIRLDTYDYLKKPIKIDELRNILNQAFAPENE